MTLCLLLFFALLLDAAMGEPAWLWARLPHPAVLMGKAVNWCDSRWNHGKHRRLKGALCLLALTSTTVLIGAAIARAGPLVEAVGAAILLAHRSLSDHMLAVANALESSTKQGRKAVSMIVGRDTSNMQPPDITRAAIESGAENFSDGVVAPAFWFLIGGLPGILTYKLVNTADSMIGHRTPRYEAFGWAAARLDDALNLAPARLSALLIWTLKPHNPLETIKDARLHRSPNAGWPEAAMSRVINVALSGPRSYGGHMETFPFVNSAGNRAPGALEIRACVGALWRAWAVGMALLALCVGQQVLSIGFS